MCNLSYSSSPQHLTSLQPYLECAPEISRVLKSSQPSTIALLIARQAILEVQHVTLNCVTGNSGFDVYFMQMCVRC
jgi:hypothetical protein